MSFELYEDRVRKQKKGPGQNCYSPYCDFIYYESSRTSGLKLAMRILKPEKPAYILVGTHGWHMSIEDFKYMERPKQGIKNLTIQVDMRGRAFSEGSADCNGWELFDIIDAVNYVRTHYCEYILDPEIVYFESGSGGGGNAYSIVGKFPDFFAAVSAFYGIADYGLWYEHDSRGEFRDDMEVWIGGNPSDNYTAYRSRSGLYQLENLLAPLFIAHGDSDYRVPVEHARKYLDRADMLGKKDLIQYLELEGVGGENHLSNAAPEQIQKITQLSERNRNLHQKPVEIPPQGRMVIAGYIVTKKFSVFLDSIDMIADVEYDLEKGTFLIDCEKACTYKIEIYGTFNLKSNVK